MVHIQKVLFLGAFQTTNYRNDSNWYSTAFFPGWKHNVCVTPPTCGFFLLYFSCCLAIPVPEQPKNPPCFPGVRWKTFQFSATGAAALGHVYHGQSDCAWTGRRVNEGWEGIIILPLFAYWKCIGMYMSLNSPVGLWYLVLAWVILTCLNKSRWWIQLECCWALVAGIITIVISGTPCHGPACFAQQKGTSQMQTWIMYRYWQWCLMT